MLDFVIADIGAGWETYCAECHKKGIDPRVGQFGHKSQEELLEMMERAKQHEIDRKKQNTW